MQTDFGADVFKPLRQEVSRSHPHFNCPERMLYRLLSHDTHFAEYLTTLPPRELLADRQQQATARARLRIEQRDGGKKKR